MCDRLLGLTRVEEGSVEEGRKGGRFGFSHHGRLL